MVHAIEGCLAVASTLPARPFEGVVLTMDEVVDLGATAVGPVDDVVPVDPRM
jgi:hypothetical protein